MAFLVKYPFASEINANIQNPLNSPFEALNYCIGFNSRVQKPITLPSFKHRSRLLQLLNICLNDLGR